MFYQYFRSAPYRRRSDNYSYHGHTLIFLIGIKYGVPQIELKRWGNHLSAKP